MSIYFTTTRADIMDDLLLLSLVFVYCAGFSYHSVYLSYDFQL